MPEPKSIFGMSICTHSTGFLFEDEKKKVYETNNVYTTVKLTSLYMSGKITTQQSPLEGVVGGSIKSQLCDNIAATAIFCHASSNFELLISMSQL